MRVGFVSVARRQCCGRVVRDDSVRTALSQVQWIGLIQRTTTTFLVSLVVLAGRKSSPLAPALLTRGGSSLSAHHLAFSVALLAQARQ